MTLSIRNPEADRLARQLAAMEKTTISGAVIIALKDALKARRREDAIESGQRILREEGLAFVPGRKPVPPSVYHEFDHDLTGEDD